MQKLIAGWILICCSLILDACLPLPSSGVPESTPTEVQQISTSSIAVDIIFYNGVLLTMDGHEPSAEAIAIRGDAILHVGSNEEVLGFATDTTQLIDLQGNTLMPGFNDAHSHLLTDFEITDLPDQNAAFNEALRLGYTSITEMYADEARLNNFLVRAEHDDLPLRVNAYLPVNYAFDRFGDWYLAYEPGYKFSPFLRIAGVKIFVDNGAYGMKFLSEPYTDNPGYYGEVFWTQDELNIIALKAHQAGYQVAVHACGDAALDLAMNAIENALQGQSNEAYHHRIEHVMIMRDDQLSRMADLNMFASVQLSFFHSDWREEFEATLGPDRVHWVGRWRDLINIGVPVIGSTDAPYGYGTIRSPFKAIYQAVTRVGEGETSPADWMLAQTITVKQALDLMTLQGAYATFQDPEKGSLTPGKLADLIILSANPLAVEPNELLEIQVWLTMVGGQTMYCAPGKSAFCP